MLLPCFVDDDEQERQRECIDGMLYLRSHFPRKREKERNVAAFRTAVDAVARWGVCTVRRKRKENEDRLKENEDRGSKKERGRGSKGRPK